MAGFLYYLPKFIGTPKVEKLRDMGLGYAFDAASCQHRGCETGPDNEGGMVVVHPSFPVELLGFYGDKQKWRQTDNPAVWIGWYTDKRPTPKDLARVEQIPGPMFEMEDGNSWMLPTAREFVQNNGAGLVSRCCLPTRFVYENRQWVEGGILGRYERLWSLVVQYVEIQVNQKDDDSFDPSALFVESLKANYRVWNEEVSELGLFDMQSFARATRALLDLDRWEELQKKTSDSA